MLFGFQGGGSIGGTVPAASTSFKGGDCFGGTGPAAILCFKVGRLFGGTGPAASSSVLSLVLAPLLLALLVAAGAAASWWLLALLLATARLIIMSWTLPRGVARGLVRQGDGVLPESLPSNWLSIISTIASSWRWRL